MKGRRRPDPGRRHGRDRKRRRRRRRVARRHEIGRSRHDRRAGPLCRGALDRRRRRGHHRGRGPQAPVRNRPTSVPAWWPPATPTRWSSGRTAALSRRHPARHASHRRGTGQGGGGDLHDGLPGARPCSLPTAPSTSTPTPSGWQQIALATGRTSCGNSGIEPRMAMLSFSNFGSGQAPGRLQGLAKRWRCCSERIPELEVDGEMQADTAVTEGILRRTTPSAGCGKAPTS